MDRVCPKIQLAPPSGLTCDVQHAQHEEVTRHLRFSCHSAQNVVCIVVRLTCALEAAILRFHQSPTSICDGAELVWHKTPAISDFPDRHETTRAWYTAHNVSDAGSTALLG